MSSNRSSSIGSIFNVEKAYGVPDVTGVLLSGGIDSTTVLAHALEITPSGEFIAISFDYGQRHCKEITYAESIAKDKGIRHEIINLSSVIPNTTLKDPGADLPEVGYDALTGVSPTYVPFRNGLMLAAATSFIVGHLEQTFGVNSNEVAHLYAGMHAEDAASFAYPDCTPEFLGSMQNAIWMGTYGRVRLHAPFISSSKSAIVNVGRQLEVDYSKTWSCYKGGDTHCGVCPTCRARKKAFADADIVDPTVYADNG